MKKWNILAEDKIIVNGKEMRISNIYVNTKKCENSQNASVRWLGIVSMPSCDWRRKEYFEVIEVFGKKYGYKMQSRIGGRPRIYREWEGQSDAMVNLWREAVYTETGLNAEFLEKNGCSILTDCGYCWDHGDFFGNSSFWHPVYKILPTDEVARCEDCNAPLAYEDVVCIESYGVDRYVCSSCYNYYRECSYCGEMFRPGEHDNFCCEDCLEAYQRAHRTSKDVSHPYSYTPAEWICHSAGHDIGAIAGRYFGIELEVKKSSSDEDVEWFNKDEYEIMYFQKHDSSVSAGTEVVFHPQTRDYFDNSGYDLITELYNNFSYLSCGTNSRIGSGLHVHIDRRAFDGDEAIRRFCQLINVKYEKSLTEFSERTADELEEWAMFHPEYPTCGEIDRYTAVNLRNDDTVEVRIFRTPAKPQKVAEVIHLLDTLVDVANGAKESCTWLDLQEARIARK